MTTLTLKFEKVYEQIIDEMVELGIAKTKSESVRMALLNFGLSTGLIDRKEILKYLRRELSQDRITPDKIALNIRRAKHETIRR